MKPNQPLFWDVRVTVRIIFVKRHTAAIVATWRHGKMQVEFQYTIRLGVNDDFRGDALSENSTIRVHL